MTGLAACPVKGMRLCAHNELELGPTGARDNRRFFLIDDRARMVNGKRHGALSAIVARYDGARLALELPTGERVEATVEHGRRIETQFFSRRSSGKLVEGPWAAAVSAYVGEPLRLVEADDAVDRGRAGAVSLISLASLARLARAAGQREVDGRRFRMLIEIDGAAAHEEDRWMGRRVRIGSATIAIGGHVGRCTVTTLDPDTGRADLAVLDVLRSYRSHADTSEPLAFGVYGAVVGPGAVRVGDSVTVVEPARAGDALSAER